MRTLPLAILPMVATGRFPFGKKDYPSLSDQELDGIIKEFNKNIAHWEDLRNGQKQDTLGNIEPQLSKILPRITIHVEETKSPSIAWIEVCPESRTAYAREEPLLQDISKVIDTLNELFASGEDQGGDPTAIFKALKQDVEMKKQQRLLTRMVVGDMRTITQQERHGFVIIDEEGRAECAGSYLFQGGDRRFIYAPAEFEVQIKEILEKRGMDLSNPEKLVLFQPPTNAAD